MIIESFEMGFEHATWILTLWKISVAGRLSGGGGEGREEKGWAGLIFLMMLRSVDQRRSTVEEIFLSLYLFLSLSKTKIYGIIIKLCLRCCRHPLQFPVLEMIRTYLLIPSPN